MNCHKIHFWLGVELRDAMDIVSSSMWLCGKLPFRGASLGKSGVRVE